MELVYLLALLLGAVGLAGGGSKKSAAAVQEDSAVDEIENPIVDDETDWANLEINGVRYYARDEEPLHPDFKLKDPDGTWYSPDYFVVVAAGQSNMQGYGRGGVRELDENVFSLNLNGDAIVFDDYTASDNNNLYFPMANKLVEELEQPVLVIQTSKSGSSIDTWLDTDDASTTGENWTNATSDIEAALSLIGQEQVNAFLWLQGEADHSKSSEEYLEKFNMFLNQIRAEDWSEEDTAILVGELSRVGVNQFQNGTLQEVELSENDPALGFVSSVGLTSDDPNGVHFDATGFEKLGARFFEEFLEVQKELSEPGSSATDNQAPETADAADIPEFIFAKAGEETEFDPTSLFSDVDGDDLFSYATLGTRGIYFMEFDGQTIKFNPSEEQVGVYDLSLYVSDYELDSEKIEVKLGILDADFEADMPTIIEFSDRNFAKLTEFHADNSVFESAEAKSGLHILSNDVFEDGAVIIKADGSYVKGSSEISGDLILGDGTSRITLVGEANITVTGNSLDNRFDGHSGDNNFYGEEGRDKLFGYEGDDTLFGGGSNDVLYGGAGDDYLSAGSGRDNVFSGEGSDTIAFHKGDDLIQIQDFDINEDKVEISGFDDVASIDDFLAKIMISTNASANRTELELEGEQLFIYDVDEEELDASLFVFVP